jgi:hypothetical protein
MNATDATFKQARSSRANRDSGNAEGGGTKGRGSSIEVGVDHVIVWKVSPSALLISITSVHYRIIVHREEDESGQTTDKNNSTIAPSPNAGTVMAKLDRSNKIT